MASQQWRRRRCAVAVSGKIFRTDGFELGDGRANGRCESRTAAPRSHRTPTADTTQLRQDYRMPDKAAHLEPPKGRHPPLIAASCRICHLVHEHDGGARTTHTAGTSNDPGHDDDLGAIRRPAAEALNHYATEAYRHANTTPCRMPARQ